MEPVVGALQGLNTGSSNFLSLPEPFPWDSDDELLGIRGIKPNSSPIPRRRSSLSCSDDDSQPPPSSSRRVSFADAFGLSLVSVKQFKTWSMCDSVDPLEVDLKDAKEYFVKFVFALPLPLEELLYRVQEQKVELETLELIPGTTTLKGTVRVLNLCFDKLVYVRTSLDCWSSHFDLLAEYVPESSDGITDSFSFKLTLVPPFGNEGAKVDFCIRYETPFGSFWANNNGQNYVLFCHEKAKDQDENDKLRPKSCLKPSRHSSMTSTTSNAEESPEIILNCGITSVVEPVAVQEEKTHEEHVKLKEENDRNCGRKNRRKSARMAKIQQRFAQRDEKDLQRTEKDTDKVDVLVPAIDEAPLNLSAPQTNDASLLHEPEKCKGQKSIAGFMDVDGHQVHQVLEGRQDEIITSQTGLAKCQNSDKSVEKAWECFEKCAMERIGSTAETYSSTGKTNHVDNTDLENSQDSQSFGPRYTFETIVAPLYQQVFARMETDRRGIKDSADKAGESVENLDDESVNGITYPSVEPRSNPEISAQRVNDDDDHGACRETVPEYFHSTQRATENALSVLNVKTNLAFPDVPNSLLDAYISESTPAQTDEQQSSNSVPSDSWEGSDQTEQTPEAIVSQSECLATTTAKPLPDIASENPQPEDRSVSQTTFKTQVSDEINTVQDKDAQISETSNAGIECLEEPCSLKPESTDMSSSDAPKIIQSRSLPPSQDLTQANIQPQIPPRDLLTRSPEETEAPVNTNVIQNTIGASRNSDRSPHVIAETESNPNQTHVQANSWEKMEKDIQAERLHTSSEDTPEDRSSQNFINENKEYKIAHLNISDEVINCDEFWDKHMAVSNISSNPKEEEEEESKSVQLRNPVNNEEQEVADMTEGQLEEVKGIREADKRSEEEKENQEQVKKEEHETDGTTEYKAKEGSFYTEDDEEELKEDNKKEDAAPRRNGMERAQESLNEEGIEEQEMVGGITSVAMLQSISNMDTFLGKVQKQEHQNIREEPVSERRSNGEEEKVFCGTPSTKQALTQNSDEAINDRHDEMTNNAESVNHEEDVLLQTDQEHITEDVINQVEALPEKQTKECVKEQSENMDDGTSTESLTDDEMELYLLRLKNTQQSGLKEMISLGRRISVSRTCTIPSPMPSIAEYMEDQPSDLLDDLINEQTTELDEKEESFEPNLLWWREFFSSDNMAKMMVYTLLLVVFLITTYVCDFIACFGLYLLALYWLYFQVQREPLKGT